MFLIGNFDKIIFRKFFVIFCRILKEIITIFTLMLYIYIVLYFYFLSIKVMLKFEVRFRNLLYRQSSFNY